MTYSGMATATLPSAQSIFTSEFEMGSGGSCSLWPPGKTGRFFSRDACRAHSKHEMDRSISHQSTTRIWLEVQTA